MTGTDSEDEWLHYLCHVYWLLFVLSQSVNLWQPWHPDINKLRQSGYKRYEMQVGRVCSVIMCPVQCNRYPLSSLCPCKGPNPSHVSFFRSCLLHCFSEDTAVNKVSFYWRAIWRQHSDSISIYSIEEHSLQDFLLPIFIKLNGSQQKCFLRRWMYYFSPGLLHCIAQAIKKNLKKVAFADIQRKAWSGLLESSSYIRRYKNTNTMCLLYFTCSISSEEQCEWKTVTKEQTTSIYTLKKSCCFYRAKQKLAAEVSRIIMQKKTYQT